MKHIPLVCLFLTLLSTPGVTQVNQITIVPANPTDADSIRIISDFSYQGNCSFGLVYNYTYQVQDTIILMPTYCGYGLTTSCNSVDTFTIGPYAAGQYVIRIEYHQGSVCPVSGFDAILAIFDTAVSVMSTSGVINPGGEKTSYIIVPNPVSGSFSIIINENTVISKLEIFNSPGERIRTLTDHQNINVEQLPAGVYTLLIHTDNSVICRKFVKY